MFFFFCFFVVGEDEARGDISTLADPGVVQHLIDTHRTMQAA